MLSIDQIKKFFRGYIGIGEPLARLTTFKVGGQADFYFEPADPGDLAVLVSLLNENQFPFVLMTTGSNILVSDHGYRGAVINLERGLGKIEFDGEFVKAGAGAKLAHFVDACVEENLHGAEMLAGIHGTLGGAVVSNERAYGGTISDHLVEVELIRRGEPTKLPKEAIIFGYRYSSLQDDIVVGASFKFPFGDKTEMKRVCRELILRRRESQPDDSTSAGWIFKNPVMNSAARLIENCGLNGLKIRDARVPEKHPNFIVNLGNASSGDILKIIRRIEDEVQTKFGVMLELDVRLLGFPERIDGRVEELASNEA
ncbi:MAG TPA: UDP-N-acetylmuramate dehydrogenase [Candidatus Acidoferrales bacterium]|nr:UDP-N-acetylmuramate dehydrogenase [Candidatus Acidoferrales bacterium]